MKSRDDRIWNFAAYFNLILFSILALVPFVLMIIAGFTDNDTAVRDGYSFFPKKFSVSAYQYIASEWDTIGRAYFMTIAVTVVGTILSLVLISTLAYSLSQKDMPGVKVLNFLVIFTMLFSGGLVPTYIIYSSILHINNTFAALVIPNYLCSAFLIILVKNYYSNSIPKSLPEAARIDGCSEFKIFYAIILPLSKPIIATIALMQAILYWNDWQNGLYYLSTGSSLYSIQNILNAINSNISYLSQYGASGANTGSLPTTTIRMAIACVGILPIIVAYPFFQKYLVAGITLGGVKE